VTALAELAREAVSIPTAERIEEGLLDVLAVRPSGRRRTVLRWSLAWATVAAAAAAIVIVTGWPRRPLFLGRSQPPLAYRIDGGSVIEGGYLREATDTGGVKLTFAEGGTSIRLKPGTRARLRSVDATGARIGIEHGSAQFDVVPHAGHRWLVDLGPFLVTVKGTRFTVSWNATTERFELCLRRGRVSVTGPMAGGEIPLEAGHRLVVDLPHGETRITEITEGEADSEPAPRVTPAPAAVRKSEPVTPASSPVARGGVAALAARGGSAKDRARDWTQALASGHLDEILNEVDRVGAKTAVDAASMEDLFALADAARYRRRNSLARDALLSARRRFPDAARTVDTDYLLGRVEEDSERGSSEALGFYDAYLARAPRGTYAAEALGRKMILTKKSRGAEAAEPVAADYLRRFPGGTYAGVARALERGGP
jgi:hypothetical protein